MSRRIHVVRQDDGSSVIETIIVAPLLMLILLLVVLAGRMSMSYIDVSASAHSAARSASLAATPADAVAAARRNADAIPAGAACAHHAVTVDTASFHPGGTVRVTISCHISLREITGVVPGTTTVTSTYVSPIDPFRSSP